MPGLRARGVACLLLIAGGVMGAPLPGAHAAFPIATAATTHTQSGSRTFTVRSKTTATITLGYPLALKFANATYSGKVRLLKPGHAPRGRTRPRLSLVRILSRGPAEGGSVFRVRVRDRNRPSAAPVRVKLTTTTTWSS